MCIRDRVILHHHWVKLLLVSSHILVTKLVVLEHHVLLRLILVKHVALRIGSHSKVLLLAKLAELILLWESLIVEISVSRILRGRWLVERSLSLVLIIESTEKVIDIEALVLLECVVVISSLVKLIISSCIAVDLFEWVELSLGVILLFLLIIRGNQWFVEVEEKVIGIVLLLALGGDSILLYRLLIILVRSSREQVHKILRNLLVIHALSRDSKFCSLLSTGIIVNIHIWNKVEDIDIVFVSIVVDLVIILKLLSRSTIMLIVTLLLHIFIVIITSLISLELISVHTPSQLLGYLLQIWRVCLLILYAEVQSLDQSTIGLIKLRKFEIEFKSLHNEFRFAFHGLSQINEILIDNKRFFRIFKSKFWELFQNFSHNYIEDLVNLDQVLEHVEYDWGEETSSLAEILILKEQEYLRYHCIKLLIDFQQGLYVLILDQLWYFRHFHAQDFVIQLEIDQELQIVYILLGKLVIHF